MLPSTARTESQEPGTLAGRKRCRATPAGRTLPSLRGLWPKPDSRLPETPGPLPRAVLSRRVKGDGRLGHMLDRGPGLVRDKRFPACPYGGFSSGRNSCVWRCPRPNGELCMSRRRLPRRTLCMAERRFAHNEEQENCFHKFQNWNEQCNITVRLAAVVLMRLLEVAMGFPKNGEVSTPTGGAGLTVFVRFCTSPESVMAYGASLCLPLLG